ncbi:MAG: geranylgeranyl hydrogenase BchP [Bacteroidia bacterium]|nr:MAG: geranylgeranyl hydrogenase BchP [Bacteroidia bacterium]
MNSLEEIVILGAGPGGCITALFLAQMNIPCTIIDKEQFPRDKICGDALSGKVVEVLKKYNPDIVTHFSQKDYQVGSWGVNFVAPNLQSLRVPFKSAKQNNETAPGFLSKRWDFDNFLFQELKKFSSVQVLENTSYEKVESQEHGWKIYLNNGKVLQSQLIIASDGAYSRFAKEFGGIKMEPAHYCAGIRTYYEGVKDLDPENFIELIFLKEFLPGYLWIFPLPNGLANVGVGMRSDVIRKKKIDLKKAMHHCIHEHPFLKHRFKDAKIMDGMKGFGLPLGSKKRKISGKGYLLVGDAASLIDPFTGEGIGNALVSGMLAAQIAQLAIQNQNFSAQFLHQYDTRVYKRLWPELRLSRVLQSLLKYPFLFNLVVNRANSNPTLKHAISCMFEDVELRNQLKNPMFYFQLIFG